MWVVGIISSPEEQYEVRVIAEIWLIGERIRSLAHQQPVSAKNRKK
jgi:hypothetical protein